MDTDRILESYMQFKAKCIEEYKITNINEIIKLFEVWLHLLE